MTSFALSLAAALATIVVARRAGWGWTAPMILYAVVWTVAIGIHSLGLFPFYEVSGTTWAAVALGFAAFVLGTFIGGMREKRRRTLPAMDYNPTRLRDLMRICFVIGIAGAGIFWAQVQQQFGLSTLLRDPIAVHTALTDRTIGTSYLFLYYFGVAAAMLFGYVAVYTRKHVRVADVMLLLTFTAAMVVSTERNHLLWVLVSWTFLVAAPPERDARLAPIAMAGVLAACVGVAVYVGAGTWLGKSASNLSGALIIEAGLEDPNADPARSERLRRPGYIPNPSLDVPADSRLHQLLPGGLLFRLSPLYMSLAAVLPSLDQGLRHHDRSYGQLTFRPAFRALSRAGLVPETLRLTTYEDVRTPYPANAYSYLYEHCRDFGLPGAVVFPGIFGFVAGFVYKRLARTEGGPWALWLAMIQGAVLWSPFQNRFVLTVSMYLVAVIALAFVLARGSLVRRDRSSSLPT